ncbi:hypothetical protein UNSWDHB_2946 [Dehalobacter sp. UNSWDHB]|uniref:response regulator n=1 Tax=unclassified Dehalobacter TaxID=2635733 RepID=UPI00028A9D21|nr:MULTISPECIES: transporter substrate-binding domain-containing protein [unclassified Dehalobacter]AFV01712.1 Sensor protein barA [Dehalobacter sp. DCA]AFV04750.1 Sensor protein barA [Dehalobacter sp. CF]EQB22764.1 hypothetical protein UNSWDHB_2946 [Dehalobacter sp. UNSWDHB]
MKRTRVILLSLTLIFIFNQTCAAQINEIEFTPEEKNFIQQHPVICVGVDPQFTPYEFLDTDGVYKGIAADYLQLISERTGIKFEISQDITWSEAYEKAVEKKLDILPCVTLTKEREEYFLYSNYYYAFQRVIVVKENNETVTDLSDLLNKTVAVKKDGSHNSFLKEFPSINLSLYLTEESALEAVAAGKESYYVGNLATASYIIKTNGLTNLKYIEVNSDPKQYLYIAVRNDWPELVGIINKGLAGITSEEKLGITNKWIGFENKIDYHKIIIYAAMVGAIILGVLLVSWFWILRLKREVAARIKAETDLKAAKDEAEAANHIKSAFLARMSHEIRTPLNAIMGLAYLLNRTPLDTSQSNYLSKIILSAKDMLAIITDILDFSKIESGKIEVERISFNLDKILQQIINISSLKIEEQHITFLFKKDPNLPVFFWGDPTKIQQILLNVINNAIKFTANGEVSVDVRLVDIKNKIHQIEFIIRDNGLGMTDEQRTRLFVPFDQGDSSILRRFGGTGLGMSIVKGFVDLLGGEIQVQSIVGKGSTFTINLPLEVDSIQEEEYERQAVRLPMRRIKALVLEKNPTDRCLLKEYLRSFKMTAAFTESGAEAEIMLRSASVSGRPFNLLIVGNNDTSDSSGIDFVQRLKTVLGIASRPKIILLVPLLRENLFKLTDEAGIELIIAKPVIASVLYNAIIEIFFKDKIPEKDIDGTQREREAVLIPDEPHHVLIVEDNKTNQMIAETILSQAGFKVFLADNGKEGYDIFTKQQQEIDLVLMDLHMPTLNGYEATCLIRGLDANIPIVAMTADAVTGVEEQCRNLGINDYISKPFEPEQLISTIWRLINKDCKKSNTQSTPQKADTALKSVRQEPVLDEAEGVKRLGNRKEIYDAVLKEFYQENQNNAVFIAAKIKDKRYREAAPIIHKIKGSAGNISAKRLHSIASELQKALTEEDEIAVIPLHQELQDSLHELLKRIERSLKD